MEEGKRELRKQVRAVEKDPTKVDSPISVAVDLQFLKQSEDPQRKAIAELRAMMQQVGIAINEINEKMANTHRKPQPIQWMPMQELPLTLTSEDWGNIQKRWEELNQNQWKEFRQKQEALRRRKKPKHT